MTMTLASRSALRAFWRSTDNRHPDASAASGEPAFPPLTVGLNWGRGLGGSGRTAADTGRRNAFTKAFLRCGVVTASVRVSRPSRVPKDNPTRTGGEKGGKQVLRSLQDGDR